MKTRFGDGGLNFSVEGIPYPKTTDGVLHLTKYFFAFLHDALICALCIHTSRNPLGFSLLGEEQEEKRKLKRDEEEEKRIVQGRRRRWVE